MLSKKEANYLKKLYTNPSKPSSFGGVDALYRYVKKDGKHQLTRSQVRSWLRSQDAYTLHRPVRYRYPRNRILVGGIDDQWQADLVDLSSISSHNDNNRYALVVVDVLSKYAWVRPVKTKTGPNVTAAMRSILDEGRKPRKLQCDQGKEFYNSHFKHLMDSRGIKMFSTDSETKAAVVERLNRTLKEKMWRYFTENNTKRYLHVLQKLVDGYNKKFHRTIGMSPVVASTTSEAILLEKVYGKTKTKTVSRKPRTFTLDIGDRVRISQSRMAFRKGFLQGWSTEIFTVHNRMMHDQPTYKLLDYNGEQLTGIFTKKSFKRCRYLTSSRLSEFYKHVVVIMTESWNTLSNGWVIPRSSTPG
jgi:hypothetical protein